MTWHRWGGVLLPLLWGLAGGATAAEPVATALAAAPDAPAALHRVADNARARLAGVQIGLADGAAVDFDLQRFSMFTADAKVVIRDGSAERADDPPAMAHFKGAIVGRPDSAVFWSVAPSGRMRGIVRLDGDIFVAEIAAGDKGKAARTKARRVDTKSDFRGRQFSCGVENGKDPVTGLALPLPRPAPGAQPAGVGALSTTPYTVRIAVDSDYEFYQLFNDAASATEYVADLFGFISTVYANELQAKLQISALYLYTTVNDPWTGTNSSEVLDELASYWAANRSNVSRALVHQVSGKPIGGLAWLDALCWSGYGFGVTGSMSGEFDPMNPQVVFDVSGLAHEIGHNFSSPHTHCYAGAGGNPSPVDGCYNTEYSCYTGAKGLPGVGSLTGGVSGAGTGTIMSYCHLLGGGESNISMTFGLNHAYGVAPGRVPAAMRSALEAAVASSPACFTSSNNLLLTSRDGQGVVTSTPPGINCGADCSEVYGTGTAVTLAAAPAPGFVFSRWAGDCAGSGSCSVTMSAPREVTAVFDDGFPANGVMPAGWVKPAGANTPWIVATDTTYGGLNSLKVGTISYWQTAEVSYTGSFVPGSVRFAFRIRSPWDAEYLRFFVDGVQKAEWHGETNWTVVAFPITAGTHTVRWQYATTGFVITSETAWIDFVSLPLAAASVALAPSTNPSVYGQGVTLTASVSGGAPTGAVSFMDGAVTLCSGVALVSGTAACATSALAVGSHSITAVYHGDGTHGPSTSPVLAHAVNKGATAATLNGHTPNPSAVGAAIAVTAGVVAAAPASGTPGGAITVSDGTVSCQISLPGGGCDLIPNTAGAKTLTASYGGDGNFLASTAAGVTHVVSSSTVGGTPILAGATSRRVHGAAGTFDLLLGSVGTNPTTEPRLGPAHTLVFLFDKAVTGGAAIVTEGTATLGAPTFTGNEMRVALTGVANQQYVTVTVSSVVAADGGTGGSGAVRVGFLAGDVNQSRVVTLADLGLVNAQVAQPVTAVNFLRDINVSGTLSLADKGLTNQQLTKALPAP